MNEEDEALLREIERWNHATRVFFLDMPLIVATPPRREQDEEKT